MSLSLRPLPRKSPDTCTWLHGTCTGSSSATAQALGWQLGSRDRCSGLPSCQTLQMRSAWSPGFPQRQHRLLASTAQPTGRQPLYRCASSPLKGTEQILSLCHKEVDCVTWSTMAFVPLHHLDSRLNFGKLWSPTSSRGQSELPALV